MTTENLRHSAPTLDGRAPEPGPWGWRRTLPAVAVAAVIAGLGGAAIYAASGNSSPQFTGPPPARHADGQAGRPAVGPGGPRPQETPLHGQVVVTDGAGGFVTMLSQTGVVTATTPDSITVRSADGFTQTWSTTAGDDPAFAVDGSVRVRGVQKGMTAEVTEVLDPLRGRS